MAAAPPAPIPAAAFAAEADLAVAPAGATGEEAAVVMLVMSVSHGCSFCLRLH
jgi:hypothetical protein